MFQNTFHTSPRILEAPPPSGNSTTTSDRYTLDEMYVQQKKWAGTEVSPQFPGLVLVSLRLWGVVFYCVAIVSVNEVQLRRRHPGVLKGILSSSSSRVVCVIRKSGGIRTDICQDEGRERNKKGN